MTPVDDRGSLAPAALPPAETEAAARDALAAFAAAWAGSVYGNNHYFQGLRSHLDAYREAIEQRVRSELSGHLDRE